MLEVGECKSIDDETPPDALTGSSFPPHTGFLKDVVTSPVTLRGRLIRMEELLGCPATRLCNFPVAGRCISEQRADLCKWHFILLGVKA